MDTDADADDDPDINDGIYMYDILCNTRPPVMRPLACVNSDLYTLLHTAVFSVY